MAEEKEQLAVEASLVPAEVRQARLKKAQTLRPYTAFARSLANAVQFEQRLITNAFPQLPWLIDACFALEEMGIALELGEKKLSAVAAKEWFSLIKLGLELSLVESSYRKGALVSKREPRLYRPLFARIWNAFDQELPSPDSGLANIFFSLGTILRRELEKEGVRWEIDLPERQYLGYKQVRTSLRKFVQDQDLVNPLLGQIQLPWLKPSRIFQPRGE